MSKKLKPGTIVWVTEKSSPWILGSWLGVVIKSFDNGDGYVKPAALNPKFRIKPSLLYLEKGLYLSNEDQITITRRKPRKSLKLDALVS